MPTDLDDAIDAMPARKLEELQSKIARRLRACAFCGSDGAVAVRAQARIGGTETRLALLLCPACIERNRLPEGRASAQDATPEEIAS